ncbi:MAG: hypothetical protein P4L16_02725 [Chlamydiales bacterium]|nr:hypothetical protein [Chlamydiales bacterium]
MTFAIVQPAFMDRVAMISSKTSGVKHGSKFIANTLELISYELVFCSCLGLSSKVVASTASLFKSAYTSVTIFGAFSALASPIGINDKQKKMNLVENVCYGISDLSTPIIYFADSGHYELNNKTRAAIGVIADILSLVGVFVTLFSAHYGNTVVAEKIAQKDLRLLALQGNNLAIGEQNERTRLIYEKDALNELNFKNNLTIIEKVIDIAAIVFGFISCFVVQLLPVVALLLVVSAGIALYKMWRETCIIQHPEILPEPLLPPIPPPVVELDLTDLGNATQAHLPALIAKRELLHDRIANDRKSLGEMTNPTAKKFLEGKIAQDQTLCNEIKAAITRLGGALP